MKRESMIGSKKAIGSYKQMLMLVLALANVCAQFRADAAQSNSFVYDLTMLGSVRFAGSIDRFPIAFADLFKKELRMNFIHTGKFYDLTDVAPDIASLLDNPDKSAGKVALFFADPLKKKIDFVPQKSAIKIAYSLLESTVVPEAWVGMLNKTFDMVIVADAFYKDVYIKSGVTKPLFVLPHGIYVEEFLEEKIRRQPSTPFVFGFTGGFWPRKNQELLVQAFHEEFANDPHVKLILQGRPSGGDEYLRNIRKKIATLKNKYIDVIYKALSDQEYKKFFNSLDCYVSVSKGEGFSITPREALALGKPTIISNNTAHKTICDTGFVYAIPSNNAESVGSKGYEFNCNCKDVRKALREIYSNYELYVQKAQGGREWVKTYLWKNLKNRFMNVISPKKVVLGHENLVTDDYIMTNSKDLYEKYISIIGDAPVQR